MCKYYKMKLFQIIIFTIISFEGKSNVKKILHNNEGFF